MSQVNRMLKKWLEESETKMRDSMDDDEHDGDEKLTLLDTAERHFILGNFKKALEIANDILICDDAMLSENDSNNNTKTPKCYPLSTQLLLKFDPEHVKRKIRVELVLLESCKNEAAGIALQSWHELAKNASDHGESGLAHIRPFLDRYRNHPMPLEVFNVFVLFCHFQEHTREAIQLSLEVVELGFKCQNCADDSPIWELLEETISNLVCVFIPHSTCDMQLSKDLCERVSSIPLSSEGTDMNLNEIRRTKFPDIAVIDTLIDHFANAIFDPRIKNAQHHIIHRLRDLRRSVETESKVACLTRGDPTSSSILQILAGTRNLISTICSKGAAGPTFLRDGLLKLSEHKPQLVRSIVWCLIIFLLRKRRRLHQNGGK